MTQNTNHIRDMRDYLQRLLNEQMTKHYPDTLLIHPSDRRWFQTGGMWQSWQSDNVAVIENEFVKPGYATWIESTALKSLKPLPSEFDNTELMDSIRLRIANAFGIPPRYFTDEPYRWQRKDGETTLVWMIRLDERGLLDDPNVRWETQKAVWQGMGQVFKKLTRIRLKVYSNHS